MSTRCLLLTVLLVGAFFAHAGEVLDRILATVNGHVILQSDLNDELRFESFMSGRVSDAAPEQRKAGLDRLIDQELLREQMVTAELKPITSEQLQMQIESLKADYLREHPGASWPAALSKYELTEKFVESHVEAELKQLQFIDTRFHSSIQVMPDEIDRYYKNELVPNLPASDPVTPAEAAPKIREILVQRKMNEMLSSWLETLRSQAQIRIIPVDSGPDSGSSSSQAGPQ